MKIKFGPIIVIPLVTMVVAIWGSFLTKAGIMWYHRELLLPSITPPDWMFPIAWNIIYILTTLAAILAWREKTDSLRKPFNMWLFIVNAILHIGWTYLFFYEQRIEDAFFEAFALEATILLLMLINIKGSPRISLLLIPYAAWTAFAILLTYRIVQLN